MTSYQNGDPVRDSAEENEEEETTNEYVLGVAFWTFVIFMTTEAFFAIIAGSQAMLTDALAMSVDALTYLFNLGAERVKHRPLSEKELQLPVNVRNFRRERLRLYLEMIPPLISVVTLIMVTVGAIGDATDSLMDPTQDDEDVNVGLMFWFSFANLFLDFFNVACFARAHQAYGLGEIKKEPSHFSSPKDSRTEEKKKLLSRKSSFDDIKFVVNLNMCSAWTHVMADTLRSAAVLIAAAIAYLLKTVSGAIADSVATIVVSIIILVSLLPLLRGLVITGNKIIELQAPTPTLDV